MVAAIDEVGRGALAGPVTVGIVVVDADTPSAPAGVRDSKLLTPEARAKIAPRLRRWAPMYAVGHASAQEIDRIGIIAALRLAACRALGSLPVQPDCALLDGSHNWLSIPIPVAARDEPALFELDVVVEPFSFGPAVGSGLAEVRAEIVPGTVVTQIKADMRCAAVAAASVLAKVERDAIMVELAQRHPGYGWELNKGYSAPEHISALRRLGPSDLHRLSWNLPGVGGEPDPSLFPGAIELDLTDGGRAPLDLRGAGELVQPGDLEADDPDSVFLDEADLDGADLDGADLEEADLEEADLEGVHLEEADLEGVQLEAADLDGADVDAAGLDAAGLDAAGLDADDDGDGTGERAQDTVDLVDRLTLTDGPVPVR
jgi:ribonuclease HII